MEQQTKDLITNEISNNEVCLFMKGTPDAPQCGFSMAVSNILKILDKNSVHHEELGIIVEKDMIINQKTKVTIDELSTSNKSWLTNYMSK